MYAARIRMLSEIFGYTESKRGLLSIMTEIDLIGQIADLKEVDYKTTLILASFVELLCEKKIINKNELTSKMKTLDFINELEIQHAKKN